MIYTVTFNPALDYVVGIDKLNKGEINRTETENIYFGGKGINVSLVLNNLGIVNTAIGFVAGFTGNTIKEGLGKEGIITDFIVLEKGMSRINVKIKADEETEINGQGPFVSNQALECLFNKLDRLKVNDILILAGSIPPSIDDDIYEKIVFKLRNKGIHFVIDARKDLLLNVLKYKPFLIKPNHIELGEIFNIKINTIEEIEFYGAKLQEMGAKNVLVSRAKDGAFLLDEFGQTHQMEAPKGSVINSVGAGDSMVAGFIAGYQKSKDYLTALKFSIATGSATAFSEGLADKSSILELYNTLK